MAAPATGSRGPVLPAPGSPGAWVLACRPRTLTAAIAPVAVGAACAFHLGCLRPGPVAAALLGALLIQVGTNLANDVQDGVRGTDRERVGPPRAVAAGLLTPAQVRAGMAVAFALATCCGLYLAWTAGWPVVAIGVLSILAGLAYTGGPWPLGYHGLGDLFVLVFFGLVATAGTAYVSCGKVGPSALVAGLGPGATTTVLLAVNNLRDLETDRKAGKRTLQVLLGRRGGELEVFLLLLLAFVGVPAALHLGGMTGPGPWLVLLVAPGALAIARGVRRARTPREWIDLLGRAARLALAHGLFLALGIALG